MAIYNVSGMTSPKASGQLPPAKQVQQNPAPSRAARPSLHQPGHRHSPPASVSPPTPRSLPSLWPSLPRVCFRWQAVGRGAAMVPLQLLHQFHQLSICAPSLPVGRRLSKASSVPALGHQLPERAVVSAGARTAAASPARKSLLWVKTTTARAAMPARRALFTLPGPQVPGGEAVLAGSSGRRRGPGADSR